MKALNRLTFLAVFVFTPIFTPLAFADSTAKILSMEGRIQVRDSASGEWRDAVAGAPLSAGSEIKTDSASTCELGFLENQKSAIRLKPGTTLVIDSASPVRLDLREGRVFSLIRELKPGATFTIKTPAAVAAARGTGGEHGVDDLVVHDGTFSVETPNGDSRAFSEGEGVFFKDEGFGETFDAGDRLSAAEWKEFQTEATIEIERAVVEVYQGESEKVSEGGETEATEEEEPANEPETDPDSIDIDPIDPFTESGLSGETQEMETFADHETTEFRDETTENTFTDTTLEKLLDPTETDDNTTGGGTTGNITIGGSTTGGSTTGGSTT